MGLCPALWGQLYAVVGNGLVDLSIFWGSISVFLGPKWSLFLLFPSDWPCRIKIIILGFPMTLVPALLEYL